jgi:HAD superfamily hydrolase (TIGR01509 family)
MKLLQSVFGSLHRFAFIFDKDGTLIDTESIYFKAFDRMLREHGCEHDLETHGTMMGASGVHCIEILQARHGGIPQGSDAHRVLLDKVDRYLNDVRDEGGLPIMPGSPSLLQQVRERGIPTAMATSARRVNVERDLKQLGWEKYFQAVVTAEDVQRHKPAPDVFLEAARRIGVEPSRCIAFEDGHRGLKSAKAAGMKVVFVRDARFGLASAPEADLTVASLEEL